MVIVLRGHASIDDIVAVVDRALVQVSDTTMTALAEAHTSAVDMSARHPTYGRTTGVGANRSRLVPAGVADYGMRLLRSHAIDAGPVLPARSVRAMLAVRLNQMCRVGSGLAPAIAVALAQMLNLDALPEVRQFGAIGTGDLTALAGTALTLIGERPASRALVPMPEWGADSALPFISSSALTIGRACLAVHELTVLERAARVVFALSFIGLRGNPAAFSAKAAAASGAPGVADVAAHLRALLTPSAVGDGPPARIQDSYGLRVFAITQGAFLSALQRLGGQLHHLLNTAQENPLFDRDRDQVIHHGAFYQAALALAVDGATLAAAQTSTITHARIQLHHEPANTGGRPFLADDQPGSSGTMMVEYVAAAAVAELRAAAQPVSAGSLSLSRGAEEDATFATQGVLQLERATTAYRTIVACELLVATRLLRHKRWPPMTGGPLAAVEEILANIPANSGDHDLRPELDLMERVLDVLGGPDTPATDTEVTFDLGY